MSGVMSCLIKIAIPKLPLDVLTYESPRALPEGSRVIVPVQKHLYAGFVIGLADERPSGFEILQVAGIIDDERVIDPDIWDMSLWTGRVCMCGVGASLKAILPLQVIEGEKIEAPPVLEETPGVFRETSYFNPFDTERVNFYVSELEKPGRSLMLFPNREAAKKFYLSLPEELKAECLLWSRGKLWQSWQSIHTKQFRIVIGSPGAVFAPLRPHRIIIEDEASSSYTIPYSLNISARSLAGHRAAYLGAEFITGGYVPSLKTYIRTHTEQMHTPEKDSIILADIYTSRREEAQGIEGHIPLTFSLVKRTRRAISSKRNVVWILNRLGEASEVFCENCGRSLSCERCHSSMRARNDGEMLQCSQCGWLMELPSRCPYCGSPFFRGRRPGIEALAKIAGKYYGNVHVYDGVMTRAKTPALYISTQKGINLCSRVNPGLVAWLDIDSELWRTDYDARFRVFSMLAESYYRGRKPETERKLLIQGRSSGLKFAGMLRDGWKRFLDEELELRREYDLPPYGYILEIECEDKDLRDSVINVLEGSGFFVMDPGEEDMPLHVNVTSLERAVKILEPYMHLKAVKITVRSE